MGAAALSEVAAGGPVWLADTLGRDGCGNQHAGGAIAGSSGCRTCGFRVSGSCDAGGIRGTGLRHGTRAWRAPAADQCGDFAQTGDYCAGNDRFLSAVREVSVFRGRLGSRAGLTGWVPLEVTVRFPVRAFT